MIFYQLCLTETARHLYHPHIYLLHLTLLVTYIFRPSVVNILETNMTLALSHHPLHLPASQIARPAPLFLITYTDQVMQSLKRQSLPQQSVNFLHLMSLPVPNSSFSHIQQPTMCFLRIKRGKRKSLVREPGVPCTLQDPTFCTEENPGLEKWRWLAHLLLSLRYIHGTQSQLHASRLPSCHSTQSRPQQ